MQFQEMFVVTFFRLRLLMVHWREVCYHFFWTLGENMLEKHVPRFSFVFSSSELLCVSSGFEAIPMDHFGSDSLQPYLLLASTLGDAETPHISPPGSRQIVSDAAFKAVVLTRLPWSIH